MKASLLHQFAFAVWAMRPECATAYMPQVDAIMFGKHQEAPRDRAKEEAELMQECNMQFATADGRFLRAGQQAIAAEGGLVAVLDIDGPVMKEDFCGAPGTATMARWLAAFEDTPEVLGVVLNIDSPGGSGNAMFLLTDQIERMGKPVVSIVQRGQACSAAYGIAAAGDLVLCSGDPDEFGSIGTYVQLRDWSKQDEQMGLVTHTVKATRSKQKNAEVDEALKADPKNAEDKHYEALRKNRIDPFNEAFIALVQRNRPGMEDADGVLEGKVFSASAALAHGLIDATGKTLADAIESVRQMSKHTTKA